MHNLNISEEDFQKIEAEEKDIQKTGIANMMIVKKKYLIYINHDEKHSVNLKEFNNELEVPSRILFKTLILFDPVPKEVYTLHTIGRYRSNDWTYKHKVNNLNDLKSRIIDRFCDDWDKGLEGEEHGKAISWLFDEKYEDVTTSSKGRKNMSTIIKVFSAKNRRLAIIRKHSEYDSGCFMGGGGRKHNEDVDFIAKAFKPKDQRYNYVSPGREFKGDVWLDDDLIGKITSKELDLMCTNKYSDDDKKMILVDKKYYANVQNKLRRQIMSAKLEQEEEEVKEVMESKSQKEFNKGSLTRNGITFTKKSISYNDLVIEGPKIEEYIHKANLITSENNDFNSIVAGYIDYILDVEWIQDRNDYNSGRYEYKFNGKANIKLGKVKIKITSDKNIYIWTDKRNRIRKDEIAQILINGLQYDSQEEYDKFVEEASSISLRVKNILDNGLTFQLVATRTNDNDLSNDTTEIQISLKIEREKSKNYLILDKKKLQIKDMNKLFNLQGDTSHANYNKYPGVQRPIKFLFDSVNDITPKDIGDLIKTGKKRFIQKVKKSKEFIEHAVKLTGATKVSDGYIVKGMSGKEYWVGNDLNVYTWKNGKKDDYLCIIDVDSERDIAGKNDCIAKRLLALSKDKVVANEIYTKGDHVDGYWKEIMEEKQ